MATIPIPIFAKKRMPPKHARKRERERGAVRQTSVVENQGAETEDAAHKPKTRSTIGNKTISIITPRHETNT